MDEDTCLISKLEQDETLRPIILNFENGTLQSGQEDNVLCRTYKNNHDKLFVAAATKDLLYSGAVDANEYYNTFIGIRNKKKNKMRLVAVDYATLSPVFEAQKELLDVSTNKANLSTSELNKQFGSKRIKRQTEQQERMQLDIENVREQLEQTVADVTVTAEDVTMPTVDDNDAGYRPPINRDAVKVEDVYSLNELISSVVLDSIAEEAERILESTDSSDWGTTQFITQEIKRLQRSSSTKKEKICQVLLYVDCLLKFMVSTAKTVSNKKYSACSYSEAVNVDILKKFTITSVHGRLRPNIMKDKCICYILTLLMIACGYSVNLETISKEMKIGVRKLQEVCRVLAFSVAKEMAFLKLPLPAVVSNVKSRKKK